MQDRTVELWVGLFVALGLAALAFLSVRASNLAEYRDGEAYTVVARFDNIGSLRVRAPVTIAGVRVGRVAAIDFDMEQFKAVVKLAITARYNTLP
ncbi:MlaD family protein, partial [Immundisolibacter sp.]